MKRIILCFDGTWCTPAEESIPEDQRVETNVSRFYESIAPTGSDGVEQVRWYNAGVGTSIWNRFAGGAFGLGLDLHILEGYRYLVHHYEDGDEVYILGFSRGAYTARSLVGMIRNCGLVYPDIADIQVGVAYGIYRTRDDGPDSRAAVAFRTMFAREIRIHFVGVWDTVGALGIPLMFTKELNSLFYQFHDTELSAIVDRAFHAVAVDENREDFAVTLWDPKSSWDQILEQRWFAGSHGNIGGGEADRRCSDLTLRWMQDHAIAAGLTVTPVAIGPADNAGLIDDSYLVFLDGLYARTHPRFLRPVFHTVHGNEVIDPTVDLRRADPAANYHPANSGLPPLAT